MQIRSELYKINDGAKGITQYEPMNGNFTNDNHLPNIGRALDQDYLRMEIVEGVAENALSKFANALKAYSVGTKQGSIKATYKRDDDSNPVDANIYYYRGSNNTIQAFEVINGDDGKINDIQFLNITLNEADAIKNDMSVRGKKLLSISKNDLELIRIIAIQKQELINNTQTGEQLSKKIRELQTMISNLLNQTNTDTVKNEIYKLLNNKLGNTITQKTKNELTDGISSEFDKYQKDIIQTIKSNIDEDIVDLSRFAEQSMLQSVKGSQFQSVKGSQFQSVKGSKFQSVKGSQFRKNNGDNEFSSGVLFSTNKKYSDKNEIQEKINIYIAKLEIYKEIMEKELSKRVEAVNEYNDLKARFFVTAKRNVEDNICDWNRYIGELRTNYEHSVSLLESVSKLQKCLTAFTLIKEAENKLGYAQTQEDIAQINDENIKNRASKYALKSVKQFITPIPGEKHIFEINYGKTPQVIQEMVKFLNVGMQPVTLGLALRNTDTLVETSLFSKNKLNWYKLHENITNGKLLLTGTADPRVANDKTREILVGILKNNIKTWSNDESVIKNKKSKIFNDNDSCKTRICKKIDRYVLRYNIQPDELITDNNAKSNAVVEEYKKRRETLIGGEKSVKDAHKENTLQNLQALNQEVDKKKRILEQGRSHEQHCFHRFVHHYDHMMSFNVPIGQDKDTEMRNNEVHIAKLLKTKNEQRQQEQGLQC